MPFVDSEKTNSPLGLPEGFDLNPETETPEGSLVGAAMRLEAPLVSPFFSSNFERSKSFDPEYRPWEDIQGTIYETYSDRFVEARDADDVGMMKAQIDRELNDRAVIDAGGGWGFLAEMGAALLSPTTLLPGGAVVKGIGGGVRIGKTAMSVAGANAVAVSLDEIALQRSQETRTGLETGMAIGGSVILGGLLGGLAGTLSKKAHLRASTAAEGLPEAIHEFNEQLGDRAVVEIGEDARLFDEVYQDLSLSAADPRADMTIAGGAIEFLNKIPIIRGLVRTDPLLRAQLSTNVEARRAVAELAETVLYYKENEAGRIVTNQPAEMAIKARRNTELAQSLSYLGRSYAEFVNDGPVGAIGRITAPITGRFGHLAGKAEKMSRADFMKEVGLALMAKDQHPIPQVAAAAQKLRKEIFDKIKQDAIDVGIFDPDLQLKNAESYFMRVYNNDKIAANWGTGNENDLSVVLRDNFKRKRDEARTRLELDDTVQKLEAERFQAKGQARGAQKALDRARAKAVSKRERAKGAITRERAVGRATKGLRDQFDRRASALRQKSSKTYIPENNQKWREVEIRAVNENGEGKMVKAGQVFDAIDRRQKAARELMECLGG